MSFLQSRAAVPVIIVTLAIVVGGVAYFMRGGNETATMPNANTADPAAPLVSEANANSSESRYLDLIEPRILGDADAPVTIIEYSSMTCPHCASFHRETLPEIKKTYIDTGKVKLEFRDYPLNESAALGALLARCAPEDRYFALVDLIFAQQQVWGSSQNILGELARLGSFAGMSQDALNACFENEALYGAIVQQRGVWSETHNVGSTPTFIVNGTSIVGAQPFATFEEAIEAALN